MTNRDRLSIHLDNGQLDGIEQEPFVIMRDGGSPNQSGLVGITNAQYYSDWQEPIVPETILNVQSTGDSVVRFSCGVSRNYRSSLELIGNGNARGSGLMITYDSRLDDAYIGADTEGTYQPGISDPATDNTCVDFSLIRPSGGPEGSGMEFSFLSASERGYIGIGSTRVHKQRHFTPNAPLTIAYMLDGHTDSGTVAIHEQAGAPSTTTNFGKFYVKPYSIGGRTQALYFKDDGGFETNLVLSQDLDPAVSTDGLIYGNVYGNTYGGHWTPAHRGDTVDVSNNTFYGYGAGFYLSQNPFIGGVVSRNTLIGYKTGSGMVPDSLRNTIVGSENFIGGYGSNNIVLGNENATGGNTINDTILIGRNLFSTTDPVDGILAIGEGEGGTIPLVTGKWVGDGKNFSINDASLLLSETSATTSFSQKYDDSLSRYITILDFIDLGQGGSDDGENKVEFRFSNSDGVYQTLWEIDARGTRLSNTPNYQAPAQTQPFAKLDADLKLKGAIRFQDGTSLSGISEFDLVPAAGTSGVNKVLSAGTSYYVLDYTDLQLAGSVSSNILTTNTYIAAQLEGSSSPLVGKISLAGLADYISSGVASIGENCNVLISNPENELLVNMAHNTRSVFLGCDVAYGASGHYNSVMIGSRAGANATIANPDLAIDWSNIFIGNSAGYDCDNVENTICIGTNAGNNADSSTGAIFIGPNAGLNTTYTRSIGFGEHALRGTRAGSEGGAGNLEIVCGFDDNQRLMHSMGTVSNRMNIQNVIAGRSDTKSISVGDARLEPTAPLEVRRDSITHGSQTDEYIQTWYCDDVMVASMGCDGKLNTSAASFFTEGKMAEQLLVAPAINSPSTADMNVYENGVATGEVITVTNRDTNLGTVAINTFVVVAKIGTEYRPMWVSCS